MPGKILNSLFSSCDCWDIATVTHLYIRSFLTVTTLLITSRGTPWSGAGFLPSVSSLLYRVIYESYNITYITSRGYHHILGCPPSNKGKWKSDASVLGRVSYQLIFATIERSFSKSPPPGKKSLIAPHKRVKGLQLHLQLVVVHLVLWYFNLPWMHWKTFFLMQLFQDYPSRSREVLLWLGQLLCCSPSVSNARFNRCLIYGWSTYHSP